jgi:hypothetical protein
VIVHRAASSGPEPASAAAGGSARGGSRRWRGGGRWRTSKRGAVADAPSRRRRPCSRDERPMARVQKSLGEIGPRDPANPRLFRACSRGTDNTRILLAKSPGQNPCGKGCPQHGAMPDKNRAIVLSFSTKIHYKIRGCLLMMISPTVSTRLLDTCITSPWASCRCAAGAARCRRSGGVGARARAAAPGRTGPARGAGRTGIARRPASRTPRPRPHRACPRSGPRPAGSGAARGSPAPGNARRAAAK